MGQELWLDRQVGVFPLSDRFAEMGGIPVNDDGGEQVEPGHAVVLALARAVADFALASDPERVLERVMSLALVQAGVGPALHIGVEQPVDDEERSFDPSDFAESDGQFVLARIGRELSQQLARRKGAAGQGGSNPQDVRPVPYDHVLPDFVAGQSDQGFRNASGLEDMQPFRWQVPDAWDEPIAERCSSISSPPSPSSKPISSACAPARAWPSPAPGGNCAASSLNCPTDSSGNSAACMPRASIPSAISPNSSPSQDQPSIAHSTGAFHLSVRSCPLLESTRFLALQQGLQAALWTLGGVPQILRSDNTSAATHEVKRSRGRALNDNYAALDTFRLRCNPLRRMGQQLYGGLQRYHPLKSF